MSADRDELRRRAIAKKEQMEPRTVDDGHDHCFMHTSMTGGNWTSNVGSMDMCCWCGTIRPPASYLHWATTFSDSGWDIAHGRYGTHFVHGVDVSPDDLLELLGD